GGHLPDKVLTNKDLESIVDTSDQWIVERTGIRQRHIAADGQFVSDLALEACRRALDAAVRQPADVDLILRATSTPAMVFPSSACLLNVPGHVCGGKVQGDPTLKMDGGAVFRLEVRVLEESARAILAENGLTVADVDAYIPHQANVRIVSHVARKLGLPDSKCIV